MVSLFCSQPLKRWLHWIFGGVYLPSLSINYVAMSKDCLLYTSDAADEEDSVDLGGRRIIKKTLKVARLDFLGGIPPKFEH